MKFRDLVFFSVLSVGLLAQSPSLAMNAKTLESIVDIFGKSEAMVIPKFGKPNTVSEYKESQLKVFCYTTKVAESGSDAVAFDVVARDGEVDEMFFVFRDPRNASQSAEFGGNFAKSAQIETAKAANYLSEHVYFSNKDPQTDIKDQLLKGQTDKERWATLSENILKLGSLNEHQVRSALGRGLHIGKRSRDDPSDFDLQYNITEPHEDKNKEIVIYRRLVVSFARGTVFQAKVYRDDFPCMQRCHTPQLPQHGNLNQSK